MVDDVVKLCGVCGLRAPHAVWWSKLKGRYRLRPRCRTCHRRDANLRGNLKRRAEGRKEKPQGGQKPREKVSDTPPPLGIPVQFARPVGPGVGDGGKGKQEKFRKEWAAFQASMGMLAPRKKKSRGPAKNGKKWGERYGKRPPRLPRPEAS